MISYLLAALVCGIFCVVMLRYAYLGSKEFFKTPTFVGFVDFMLCWLVGIFFSSAAMVLFRMATYTSE